VLQDLKIVDSRPVGNTFKFETELGLLEVQVRVHHISTCTGTCTCEEHENLHDLEKNIGVRYF
jgi:hypothetical protein